MSDFSMVDRFLSTDPRDGGCDLAMELLDVYAELAAVAPDEAERRYVKVAAHLAACGDCSDDLQGLLKLVIGESGKAQEDRSAG